MATKIENAKIVGMFDIENESDLPDLTIEQNGNECQVIIIKDGDDEIWLDKSGAELLSHFIQNWL